MKKFITILTVALCAVALTASAAKGKKKALTDDQKALLEKYDANKDGMLDAAEFAALETMPKERKESK